MIRTRYLASLSVVALAASAADVITADLYRRVAATWKVVPQNQVMQAVQSAGTGTSPDTQTNRGTRTATGTGTGLGTGTGTATFAGPIHPNTIRKIACDADIIPVLLGSEGRILDIGRTTRIFPPHIRKAITARDGGCAFPDCEGRRSGQCSKCHALYCDRHLQDREETYRQNMAVLRRPVSLCDHCAARSKLLSGP